ncbi:MAG TPA: hypothetical protein PLL06_10425 [Acidobacteriota bacterium]|nr:hypothetical protein [Acidobacteriota bacterium]
MRKTIETELKIWAQYFLISLFSTIVAYFAYTHAVFEIGEDLNPLGMIKRMIPIFLSPWCVAFVAFSLVRFFALYWMSMGKSSDKIVDYSKEI